MDLPIFAKSEPGLVKPNFSCSNLFVFIMLKLKVEQSAANYFG